MSTARKKPRGNPARRARLGIVTEEGMHFGGDRARPNLLDNPAPGKHLWIAAATHVLTDESAAGAHNGGQVHLDAETIAFIGVGCYVCEQQYSPELAARRCGGEPASERTAAR